MEKLIGVYIIKHKITNKFYVGHSVDIYQRFNSHKSYLKRGIHHCIYLQRAWDKYGEDNFDFIIIKLYNSELDSIELEQYYINNFKDSLYNVADNANFGGDLLSNNPNKTKIIRARVISQKERLSKMTESERIEKFARKGTKNGMYGKTHSERVKRIISEKNKGSCPVNKGKTLEESVGKTRATEIKRALSDYAKNRVKDKNPFYGKHHSDKTKSKLREAMLGRKPVNMKKVKIDNKIYPSVTKASRDLNVTPATIIYRIKSKNYPNYEYYDIK